MKRINTLIDKIEGQSNRTIVASMIGISLLFVVVGLIVSWAGGRIDNGSGGGEKVGKVAVSVYPLYDLVREIAGGQIEVVLLLPPGASPHGFEPTAEGLKKISGSRAAFLVGHGLDDWAQEIALAAEIDEVIVPDELVTLLGANSDGGGSIDPHYWLNVPNAILIGVSIRDELSLLFPDLADDFATNQNELSKKLSRLDAEIRPQLAGLSNNKLATFHGGWEYLAGEYGLEVVAVFEEAAGKELTPRELAGFGDLVAFHNLRVVYSEPQLPEDQLRPLAQDLGLAVVQLDPLGGAQGRESYTEMLRYNVGQIINSQ